MNDVKNPEKIDDTLNRREEEQGVAGGSMGLSLVLAIRTVRSR